MTETEQIQELFSEIALQNSQQAYRRLFIRLHKPLLRFAYGILKSNDDAEEVVSDVFINLWQKRQELTAIESPLLYIYTAVKNRALNVLAKQKRQEAADASQWLVPLNSVSFNPEQLMISQETILRIRKAVDELPARCRLIFLLIKEDGLRYREVAELLNISVKTVEAQMAIAMRRMAQCMHLQLPVKESANFFKK
ncbi:RNA polymerase sigma-70 factor (ECF subfamily) [Lacibacter cauensis]|uniref:RNA polymerase sigma-70 factor (ECF subfamily) n=1 Tax=Lacibacter cauensis TaxID=510947 RepID=A0A562SSW9_9BACT|nr:RNA polymerase sigma-70 factor [Lacibacter cauensis]TWI83896.1 RNA polymerase sigma-70 factor (ECF subfamily) [Lacibacter cauensis]